MARRTGKRETPRTTGVLSLMVELTQAERIQLALRRCGKTLADVSRDLGVTKPAVSAVVRGEWRSRRVEDCIALLLGVPAERLFGPRHLSGDSVARDKPSVNVGVSGKAGQRGEKRRRAA